MSRIKAFFQRIDIIGGFILTRYPFLCLFFLLMVTGDSVESSKLRHRDKKNMNFYPVYINIAIYFTVGTGMTMDFKRRLCGFIAAVHLGIVTSMNCLQWSKIHDEWTMVRLISKDVVVMGGYLLIAGGLADGTRTRQPIKMGWLNLGRQILAAYSFCSAYMLWLSHDDRQAFVTHLPGGKIMMYFIVLVYVVCGVFIYGGFRTDYFGKLLAWILLVVVVLVELDTKYWIRKLGRRIGYWEQLQTASRNVAAIGSLLMIGKMTNWD